MGISVGISLAIVRDQGETCREQAEEAPDRQAEELKTKQNKTGHKDSGTFLNGGSDMFKEELLWFCGNDFMTQYFMAVGELSNYVAEPRGAVIWPRAAASS